MPTDKTKHLFRDFPPPSPEEWHSKLKADLKGKEPASLDWKTGEGFVMRPMYFRQDLNEALKHLPQDHAPGSFPYLRGSGRNGAEIRQSIYTDSIGTANQLAVELSQRGATGLEFLARLRYASSAQASGQNALSPPPTKNQQKNHNAQANPVPKLLLLGLNIQSKEKLLELFSGLKTENLALHFRSGLTSPFLLRLFWDAKIPAKRLTFDFDPLALLLETGFLPSSFETQMDEASQMLAMDAGKIASDLHPILAQGRVYREAGAGAVLELACVLAAGSEYLEQMQKRGHSTESLAKHIHLELSIGPSYFLEMARLRVLRLLWSRILVAYGLSEGEAGKGYVSARALYADKTRLDAHTNLLRTTTEAMSAILGGADSFIGRSMYATKDALGFDEFGERIARNTQIMLYEESYLGRVKDPAAGSYYIENLVQKIAEAAWKEFQAIEAQGGILASIRNGALQERISQAGKTILEEIAQRKRLVLGTNQYPNLLDNLSKGHTENAPTELAWKPYIQEEDAHYIATGSRMGQPGKSEKVHPLVPIHWGEEFEDLRQRVEALPKKPQVFLYVFGNAVMRRARASFAANFFGCAGLPSIDHPGFEFTEEGIQAGISEAKKNAAQIVVLCASDEDYAREGVALVSRLKESLPNSIFVVAGNPDCLSELREAGLSFAIHARSNVLATLHKLLQELQLF